MPSPAYRRISRRGATRAIGVAAAIAVGFGLAGAAATCGGSDDFLLATTTSVNDSGLLDELVPVFERESGINVKVIAVGTGAALRMAELGNADALFVHAPSAEQVLVEQGDVVDRRLVAYNDFLIAGPPDDPAGLAGMDDVAAALTRLSQAGAEGRARFLSRGDDSGTHKREQALWVEAGLQPTGEWYLESGQGMGASLQVASQRRAYVLTDRATFLALRGDLDLAPLVERDPLLINLYSVMRVNPDKGDIHADAAIAWLRFITRDDVQARIAAFRAEEFGRPLFIPAAGNSEAEVTAEFAASR
ncbi:MAG: substrate-binding domain-containing protein [Chloroflexi bacterium]|nr:substrate-binding domain-containing protein [Chloroflexota bacterium]